MSVTEVDKRRIGIYGGTFDPPHIGHLVAAQTVLEEQRLGEILFVPSGTPPHKGLRDVTPARHRYLMTVMATLGNPRFSVSRIEVDREATSYTVDTLEQLSQEFGDGTQMYFILGADAMLELSTWKDPDRVLALCHMVAVTRPGHSYASLADRLGELYIRHADRIHIQEIPSIDVSSSGVRDRVRQGQSIRYLVPDIVRDYIKANKLYVGS